MKNNKISELIHKEIAIFLFLFVFTVNVNSHGRLMEPPGRSTVWRYREFFHLNPAVNYDDNALNCGGRPVHHQQNGGRCGECGDPWQIPRPRQNENGGKYGRGIITRNYLSGQMVEFQVELTATHRGYFEFRLCPVNNSTAPINQSCLDQYPVQLADGSGTQFPIRGSPGLYKINVSLPVGLRCSRCVLQWHYKTGNDWGVCEDGTGALGCGPQETFRACSDILIE